ncbi:hypothetical protein Tco_0506034 [Tanacetum coccineum]
MVVLIRHQKKLVNTSIENHYQQRVYGRLERFDSIRIGLRASEEGIEFNGELIGKRNDLGEESIEMSRFSTDSTRSDSASKESIPGGIEWMHSSTSSLIRSTLVEAISSSRSKRGLEKNDKYSLLECPPWKNGLSLKVLLRLAKLPCSLVRRFGGPLLFSSNDFAVEDYATLAGIEFKAVSALD